MLPILVYSYVVEPSGPVSYVVEPSGSVSYVVEPSDPVYYAVEPSYNKNTHSQVNGSSHNVGCCQFS